MSKFDKKTRSILYELDTNSRQSNSQIAKAVAVSKDVVNYRIQKLEKEGVIQYYTAIIDSRRLGYVSTRIILSLMNASSEKQKDLIDYLVNVEEIFFVSQHESSSDIVLGFISKENILLQKFVDNLKEHYSSIIENIDFAFYDELYHLHRKYLTDKVVPIHVMSAVDYVEHDELDIQLLKELTKNARVPVTSLSKILNKPITTIISRIKNLEKKKVILGYTAILSSEKLGMEYSKIEAKLNDTTNQKGILEYCSQHPNIIYFMKTTGNWDAEIFVEIESTAKLHNILEEIQKKFPIRKILYRAAMKYYKFRYF